MSPKVKGRVEMQCSCNRASAHCLGVLELKVTFQRCLSQSLAVATLQGGQNLGGANPLCPGQFLRGLSLKPSAGHTPGRRRASSLLLGRVWGVHPSIHHTARAGNAKGAEAWKETIPGTPGRAQSSGGLSRAPRIRLVLWGLGGWPSNSGE